MGKLNINISLQEDKSFRIPITEGQQKIPQSRSGRSNDSVMVHSSIPVEILDNEILIDSSFVTKTSVEMVDYEQLIPSHELPKIDIVKLENGYRKTGAKKLKVKSEFGGYKYLKVETKSEPMSPEKIKLEKREIAQYGNCGTPMSCGDTFSHFKFCRDGLWNSPSLKQENKVFGKQENSSMLLEQEKEEFDFEKKIKYEAPQDDLIINPVRMDEVNCIDCGEWMTIGDFEEHAKICPTIFQDQNEPLEYTTLVRSEPQIPADDNVECSCCGEILASWDFYEHYSICPALMEENFGIPECPGWVSLESETPDRDKVQCVNCGWYINYWAASEHFDSCHQNEFQDGPLKFTRDDDRPTTPLPMTVEVPYELQNDKPNYHLAKCKYCGVHIPPTSVVCHFKVFHAKTLSPLAMLNQLGIMPEPETEITMGCGLKFKTLKRAQVHVNEVHLERKIWPDDGAGAAVQRRNLIARGRSESRMRRIDGNRFRNKAPLPGCESDELFRMLYE